MTRLEELTAGGTLFVALLMFLYLFCAPLAIIWSLNVLFGLGIGYTIKTWAAAFILLFAFRVRVSHLWSTSDS